MVIEAHETLTLTTDNFYQELVKFGKEVGIDFEDPSFKIIWMRAGCGLNFVVHGGISRCPSDGINILYEGKRTKKGFKMSDLLQYYDQAHKQMNSKIVANSLPYACYLAEEHHEVGESGSNLYKDTCICKDKPNKCHGALNFLQKNVCKNLK